MATIKISLHYTSENATFNLIKSSTSKSFLHPFHEKKKKKVVILGP